MGKALLIVGLVAIGVVAGFLVRLLMPGSPAGHTPR
jgi:preprotein translocase subunit Sss1